MRRVLVVLMVATLMMALSGAALAQGGADLYVSFHGTTKVQKGTSTCSSDSTSKAVAVNGGSATATHGSTAEASDGSTAFAEDNSKATASNCSRASALDNCTATAHNGEVVRCP